MFDSVAVAFYRGVLHIAEARVFEVKWFGRGSFNLQGMLEGVSERKFDLVLVITKCPVVNVKRIDSIVGFQRGFGVSLDNRPFRQVEPFERCSDTVLRTVLARYIEMDTLHDEIGVIDETREGPGVTPSPANRCRQC